MTKTIATFVLILLAGISFCQDDIVEYTIIDADNLKKWNLNGSVKSVDYKSFKAELFELKDSLLKKNNPYLFYHSRTYFDSIGRVKRGINYSDKYSSCVSDFKYDSQNKPIQRISLNVQTFDIMDTSFFHWVENDTILLCRAIEKDSQSNEVEFSTKYHFGEDKNITKVESIKNGTLIHTFVFEYDSDNRIINSGWYSSNGSLLHKWTYEYDQAGNLTKRIKSQKTGIVNEVREFEYDSSNNRIIDRSSRGGAVNWERRFVYEYDSKNNWIKCVTWKDGKESQIAIREIVYN